jgi:hypothetical protein
MSREYNAELVEVTLAHYVQNIYTAGIEVVNVLAKMQESLALEEGAEVPSSIVRQIAAERASLEEEQEAVHHEKRHWRRKRRTGPTLLLISRPGWRQCLARRPT